MPSRQASWRTFKTPPVESREDQIVRHVGLLEQRLARVGLCERQCRSDGHCQFRALSFELLGSSAHHRFVRDRVHRHMARREAHFGPFVEGGTFAEYLAALAAGDSWGDELTLVASAAVWDCVIHVVTAHAENFHLVYGTPSRAAPTQQRLCFLSYVQPVHYNVICPADAPASTEVL